MNTNLWVHSPRVAFPRTVVHNAIGPAAFTDLDLSAVVGARQAEVLLSFLNNSGGNCAVYTRRNGEAAAASQYGAGGITASANGEICYAKVVTDVAGIIEWAISNVAGTHTVIVEAYAYV